MGPPRSEHRQRSGQTWVCPVEIEFAAFGQQKHAQENEVDLPRESLRAIQMEVCPENHHNNQRGYNKNG